MSRALNPAVAMVLPSSSTMTLPAFSGPACPADRRALNSSNIVLVMRRGSWTTMDGLAPLAMRETFHLLAMDCCSMDSPAASSGEIPQTPSMSVAVCMWIILEGSTSMTPPAVETCHSETGSKMRPVSTAETLPGETGHSSPTPRIVRSGTMKVLPLIE